MFPLRILLLTTAFLIGLKRLALALALLCLPATALALDYDPTVGCNRPYGTTEQCQFDSNAAAWFDRAATWPGAGPIFDARNLVIATYTTFTVYSQGADTAESDAAFFGQTVCRGDAPYCPEPYVRVCCIGGTYDEANSELFHMVLSQPVLGILFEGGSFRTWAMTGLSLRANRPDMGAPEARVENGLPHDPTSFGFLMDHLVFQLDGRQNNDPEGMAECCPVPLFAIGPTVVTPTPEPGTWVLVGSGLVGLLTVGVRRGSARFR